MYICQAFALCKFRVVFSFASWNTKWNIDGTLSIIQISHSQKLLYRGIVIPSFDSWVNKPFPSLVEFSHPFINHSIFDRTAWDRETLVVELTTQRIRIEPPESRQPEVTVLFFLTQEINKERKSPPKKGTEILPIAMSFYRSIYTEMAATWAPALPFSAQRFVFPIGPRHLREIHSLQRCQSWMSLQLGLIRVDDVELLLLLLWWWWWWWWWWLFKADLHCKPCLFHFSKMLMQWNQSLDMNSCWWTIHRSWYGKTYPMIYSQYKPFQLSASARWTVQMIWSKDESMHVWWFQRFFIRTLTWGNDLIWRALFSVGWFNHQQDVFLLGSLTISFHNSKAFFCPRWWEVEIGAWPLPPSSQVSHKRAGPVQGTNCKQDGK